MHPAHWSVTDLQIKLVACIKTKPIIINGLYTKRLCTFGTAFSQAIFVILFYKYIGKPLFETSFQCKSYLIFF